MPLLPRQPDGAQPIRERVKRLEPVVVDGLDRAQRKAARQAAYRLATARAKQEHRENLIEMRKEEQRKIRAGELKRQYPGRRGGRRVRLVWADTATFTTWQDEYQALPRLADTRFTLGIGETAYEFPGDEVTPPSGRRFTEIQATEEEQDWFEAQGVQVCYAGTFNVIPDEEPAL